MKSVVNDVVREEIRSAMLVYADGSCKCADEVLHYQVNGLHSVSFQDFRNLWW